MGIIDKAVKWAVDIANDDSHKYSQSVRFGPHYDCSSFVITAYTQAGLDVRSAGAEWTGDMYNAFIKKGFKNVTNSVNRSNGSGMKKGDVLLAHNSSHKHAALVRADGGAIVHASNYSNGICTRSYYNCPWDYVLRYPENSSSAKIQLEPKRTITLPSGLGKVYTYETWNREEHGYSAWRYDQKKLIEFAKERGEYSFDSSGYGRIGDRYVVAMTSTYGAIGDYVDIYCADGSIINAVIGDEKNQNDAGCNRWGHDNGQCVVEFMTNWPAEPVHTNPPGNGGITKVINYGSYFTNPSYAANDDSSSETKDITSQQIAAAYGAQMAIRRNEFEKRKNSADEIPDIELYIINWSGQIFRPVIADRIEWETAYSGSPAQLTFTAVKDESLSFHEGSQVVFKYKGAPVFYGFVFKKSRSRDHHIKCTCYDQTRYLQNKNSMVYSDKTATEVIRMIANDFSLKVGELTDTGIKIPLRVEDNSTLFDTINYALNYTTNKTGVWYTFYDDFGKLTLLKSADMRSNCIITQESAEDFDYETSINESTYTRIRRYYDNKETGIKELYTYDESAKRPYYGILQLCEKIDDADIESFRANAEEQMKRSLQEYSDPTRTLSIKNVFGDVMVRAGSVVGAALDLGDIIVNSQESGHYFVCDSVKHTFSYGGHMMDVNLTGGGYRFI